MLFESFYSRLMEFGHSCERAYVLGVLIDCSDDVVDSQCHEFDGFGKRLVPFRE